MASRDEKPEEGESTQRSGGTGGSRNDNSRRHFLRVALTLGVVFVTAGIAAVAKSLVAPSAAPPGPTTTSTKTGAQTSQASPFPTIVVAKISDLSTGKPVSFNYPLEETPNILVKLGQKADGGVGPDGDIVAFSQVCQHLGCIYSYLEPGASPSCDSSFAAAGPMGFCCCHGGQYDFLHGAKVIGGPPPRAVPQVTLSFDAATGNISAIGMGPPTIFGHSTGSSDVLNDLQGGTVVSA